MPAVRVSDEERSRVVDVLRAACADGRLTLDEFADRAGLAYGAKTAAELEILTADLPAAPPAASRRAPRRWIVAIMSGARTRGRWRAGSHVNAFAFWGGAKVDLREAELDQPEVHIQATAIMGGVEIVVPEGVDVEMTGIAIMGGKECRVKEGPRRPGAPLVHVQAFAFWGSVVVRSAGPRRPRVRAERVDRARRGAIEGPASLTEGTVTLLITDVEDFTGLCERLGDARAQAVLAEHNTIVRTRAGEHGGREIKSLGDSFMLAFTSVSRALRCAADIQRDLDARAATDGAVPVRVRMGVHTGEALRDEDDLFGRSVIVASRIADHARGGEILVSSLVVDLAGGEPAFVFDEGRDVELKGLSRPQRVHALKWNA